MKTIRVILADDHTIVREGIRSLIESKENIEVVAEVENGRDAVQKTAELKPDVVIMDISMPILNGFEATRQVVRQPQKSKVLVLTMHEDRETIRQVLRAGAAGCLSKKSAVTELVDAIVAVDRGEAFFSPSVSKLLLEDYMNAGPVSAEEPLTSREKEVLQMVSEGRGNKEIADLLCISVKTVEGHKENIKKKIGARDAIDLLRYAISKGLIPVDAP